MKGKKKLGLGRMEFVFEPGFERDLTSVLSSYIYHEIKSELLEEGKKICEENDHLLKTVFR